MNHGSEQLLIESAHGSTRLDPGGFHAAARDSNYRDAPSEAVTTVVNRVRAGIPWRQAVREAFEASNPWLHRIVTHPSRQRVLEHVPLRPGSLVLDVGSGWGQFALPLAARHRVCALEPTPERMDFIRSAAEQDALGGRMYFVQADYLSVGFPAAFDAIFCIGVLEWIGKFSSDPDPQETRMHLLAKFRRELGPGGRLVLGIENRLGLKYLLGARDDHTGVAGISVLDRSLADRRWRDRTGTDLRVHTFSRIELEEMLRQAGFQSLQFLAAFPDYKLPELILPLGEPVESALREGRFAAEHDGCDGTPLPHQEELRSHYRSLARLGIASNFVPSFYVLAS